FARELKAMVPKSVLAGAEFLAFLPGRDPQVFAATPGYLVVNDTALSLYGGMLGRNVGHDHLVTPVAVLEEIVDPLFLHQPAGEIEVGLAVLNAIIPLVVGGRQFVADIKPDKQLA